MLPCAGGFSVFIGCNLLLFLAFWHIYSIFMAKESISPISVSTDRYLYCSVPYVATEHVPVRFFPLTAYYWSAIHFNTFSLESVCIPTSAFLWVYSILRWLNKLGHCQFLQSKITYAKLSTYRLYDNCRLNKYKSWLNYTQTKLAKLKQILFYRLFISVQNRKRYIIEYELRWKNIK